MLPLERQFAEGRDPGVLILYGPPKIGKTTLINKLNNNLILDFEKGTKYLNTLSIHIIGVEAPTTESKESVRERQEERGEYYLTEAGRAIWAAKCPYDFITVDTVTELEDMLKPVALKLYRATPMGVDFKDDILSLPRGGGYYYLRLAFKDYVDRLKKLTKRLILIGHLKETFLNKAGKEVNAKDLDLTGKIKTIACAGADAVGYVYRGENSEIRINFKSADEVICGARPDHLKGQDLKIADYDPEKNDLANVNWGIIYPDAYNLG